MTKAFASKEGINPSYITQFPAGAYIGMADSALHCMNPKFFNDFYVENMTDCDYFCGDDEDEKKIVQMYPDWNEKWYNAICRPWFKD